LLQACLQKDPKRRLRDLGDAWWLVDGSTLDEVAPVVSESRRHVSYPWIVAALLAVFCAALGYVTWHHVTEAPPLASDLYILPPERSVFPTSGATPAVSPDGRHIVFVARVEDKTTLWLRDLNTLTARVLPGTEGALSPFWSPDNRWIGFFASRKLKKIDVDGGSPLTLCDAPGGRGGSWSKNDLILFAAAQRGGLWITPAAGGVPTPATELDQTRKETTHRYPWFLPDGRHFLFSSGVQTDPARFSVFLGDLDSKKRVQVIAAASYAAYVAPGYLLFLRGRTLMAQPFDASKLQTTGSAAPAAEQVDYSASVPGQFGQFGASQNGVLAYTSGALSGGAQITWFDRSGKALGTVGPPGNISSASLSPDGATVATDLLDPQSENRELWLHDLARGTATRLTFTGPSERPIWSPDGTRIAFFGQRDGVRRLYEKAANSTGPEAVLEESAKSPDDWSRDGRYLITENLSADRTADEVWIHPFFGQQKPFAYLQTQFGAGSAKLSPNGQWLAYQSNESRRYEVYVVSFPTPGFRQQMSSNGGTAPVWSKDGRELYFIGADEKMMSVDIKAGAKFEAGIPKTLFNIRLAPGDPTFDVSKDGRFLIPARVDQPSTVPITVMVNWQAGLKK
jgi:Tol biopolymer transport system component